MTESPDLPALLDELYGLPPEEFIAARDAEAKQLKASGAPRELLSVVKGARRPTVAAWLLNTLVRERADQVQPFLQLGEGLREAQATLQGDQLRALSRQRQQLIAALVREVRGLAGERGRRLSDAIVRELEETLDAALADPDAAAALASGRLVSGLEHVGFGATQSSSSPTTAGADERPVPNGQEPRQHERRRQELQRDELRRQELQRQLDEARRREEEATTAEREAATAFSDSVTATQSRRDEVDRLQRQLATAREHLAESERHEASLRAAADKAREQAGAATAARERAEHALRDLDPRAQ
ncbi:MAG: hypothetical protein ACTHMW_15810 [Actinomycetes bacterium]